MKSQEPTGTGFVGGPLDTGESRKLKEQLTAFMASPELDRLQEQVKRLSARPAPSFVFVDGALPSGVRAELRLNEPNAFAERYAIVAEATFDDAVVDLVPFIAFSYDRKHEDQLHPVTIRLFQDGRVAIRDLNGVTYHEITSSPRDGEARTEARSLPVLRGIATARAVQVPGYGTGRLVSGY